MQKCVEGRFRDRRSRLLRLRRRVVGSRQRKEKRSYPCRTGTLRTDGTRYATLALRILSALMCDRFA
jgi:hypothetical protein